MDSQPRARIELADDGTLVMVDPDAAALIGAVACENLYRLNEERVAHFARRMVERGLRPEDVLITCLDVNDKVGERVASVLMPGYNWQGIRDEGEWPVARGLAVRLPLLDLAEQLSPGIVEANPLRVGEAQVLVIAGGAVVLRGVVLPGRV